MEDIDLAIHIWRSGEPIPVDLAARLISEGYDIDALEDQYMNNPYTHDNCEDF